MTQIATQPSTAQSVVQQAVVQQGSDRPLKPLWPVLSSAVPLDTTSVKCDETPKAVVSLSTESRYSQSDDTRTTVDATRDEAYEKQIAPVRAFSLSVVSLANRYTLSKGQDQKAAYCAANSMVMWAKDKALTEAETDTANFNRATFLAAVSAAYTQISGSKYVSAKERMEIEPWLIELSGQTRAFYQQKRDAKSVMPNNIQYWGSYAVASAAIALNRPQDLDWALEGLELGVCTANDDGSMPRELSRKQRARHYHLFALQPLTALAELAERNGREGYDRCDGALHKIVAFTLKAVDDATEIESLAGAKQLKLDEPIKSDNNLAWLEIYASRFPSFLWSARMNDIRPFANSNLGGKMTELYMMK